MTDSGLNDQDTLGCALLLDGYARSTARLAHNLSASKESAATIGFLRLLLKERGFPRAATLTATMKYIEDELVPSDVEYRLDRILAGIEALIIDRNRQPPE